jgi:Sulfatase-modifying factor enzyme 1
MTKMRALSRGIITSAALVLLASTAGAQGAKPLKRCSFGAVVSGTVCMDKYEASVWRVPNPTTLNKTLVVKIQQGFVTPADLTAGGATQLGVSSDDYAPCADSGQNCANDIYAVSLPGVTPSRYLTWFQAQVACRNAAKRLPSNAEWQGAVVGTPDPGPDNGTTDCNSASGSVSLTGSRSSCVSARGAFDMVGNLDEWVAEWLPRSTVCGTWSAGVSPTGDYQCLAGAATTGEPGVLVRGGIFSDGSLAGPLAIPGNIEPSISNYFIGFRCTR